MRRSVLFGLALILMPALAGCANDPTKPVSRNQPPGFFSSSTERFFTEAYQDLATIYLASVSIRDVALKGMESLNSIDPALMVTASAGQAAVSVAARTIAVDLPHNDDPDEWAQATAATLYAAGTLSPKIASMQQGELQAIVFKSAIKDLPGNVRYLPANEPVASHSPNVMSQSVRTELLAGNIGYILIPNLRRNVDRDIAAAIKNLQGSGALRGLIIDLRGNPGGLLPQSVAVANLFLKSGVIATTHGRHPDSEQHFDATGPDITAGLLIDVLIDKETGTGAEIIAGALQDNHRATIIGSISHGAGTIDTVLFLPQDGSGGEIIIPWTRLYLPSGYRFGDLGVLPDICMGDPDGLPATSYMVDQSWRDMTKPGIRNIETASEEDRRKIERSCQTPETAAGQAAVLEIALKDLTAAAWTPNHGSPATQH